jgi:hypothetical protein
VSALSRTGQRRIGREATAIAAAMNGVNRNPRATEMMKITPHMALLAQGSSLL